MHTHSHHLISIFCTVTELYSLTFKILYSKISIFISFFIFNLLISYIPVDWSLSADHDGTNNACQLSDKYIMAPVFSVPPNVTTVRPGNIFDFSICSVTSFVSYLAGYVWQDMWSAEYEVWPIRYKNVWQGMWEVESELRQITYINVWQDMRASWLWIKAK